MSCSLSLAAYLKSLAVAPRRVCAAVNAAIVRLLTRCYAKLGAHLAAPPLRFSPVPPSLCNSISYGKSSLAFFFLSSNSSSSSSFDSNVCGFLSGETKKLSYQFFLSLCFFFCFLFCFLGPFFLYAAYCCLLLLRCHSLYCF